MEIKLDQLITPFNLRHTLECGQTFRWKRLGDWWYGVVRGKVIKIKQVGDKLQFQSFPERVNAGFIQNYFRLDDDLPFILSEINKDEHIRKAIQKFYGLRIIRQEPWECLISYICATYKNIPAIKEMIRYLCRQFGRKIAFDGYSFYTFPRSTDLAEASIEDIRKCKLGFRARRVLETLKIINSGELDLETLRRVDYEEAKLELLGLPGVGYKVADCVLLFSLDRLQAFPVDVWIKKIILEFYPKFFNQSFIENLSKKGSITHHDYKKLSDFGKTYFGSYGGYAQEYLFYWKRSGGAI
jgi:N-glycosylase/DNA lyase